MLLSVIIPIYKVESTLDRCVTSVLAHDVDMEVILVDDGSPDNCPEMCDQWVGRDNRIKVIHKENGGLSDARNAGIAIAKGNYITFIDSDDELVRGTLSAITEALVCDCDILEYPIRIDVGNKTEHLQTFQNKEYDISTPDLLRKYWAEANMQGHCYACNKVFKRSIFSSVEFPKGKAYEDIWTIPLLLKEAKTIKTISKGEYLYYYNKEGICRSGQNESARLKALLHAGEAVGMDWGSKNASNMLMDILNCQVRAYQYDKKIDEKAAMLIRKIPFSAARSWHEKVKLTLLRLVGIKVLCFLLSLMNVFDFSTFHVKNTLK